MSKILTSLALLGLGLSILFLDIGQFTPWIYEHPSQQIFKKGIIPTSNPFEQVQKIIQLIQQYQVNYLVLEREEEDHLPQRTDNNFKDYLWIIHSLLIYCQLNDIKGAVILPRTQLETRKWREKKNYCWRKKYSQNEHWCYPHQRIETTKVPLQDEVDVQSIREIFWFKIVPSSLLLQERERIFNLPMNVKKVEDYQKTYSERMSSYRIKQNQYAFK